MVRWTAIPLIFLSYFLFVPPYLFSQSTEGMQAQCLQILRGGSNTTLFISLDPDMAAIQANGLLETHLDYLIEFRDPITDQVIFSKSFTENSSFDFFSGRDPLFREFLFELLPGLYSVSVDVFDRKSGRGHLSEFQFECRTPSTKAWISDIVLLQEREGALDPQPLVGKSIGGITDRIRFQSDIYGNEEEVLTARAVLYRQQQPPPGSDDREFMKVNQYSSAVQINEIIELKDGKSRFAGGIDLGELEQGSYLLEIFLYRDDSLIAEKNASFIIPWKRLKEVFLDLKLSISMMSHITSPSTIEELLGIKEEGIRIAKFMSFWEDRADPNLEDASAPLERYFTRIFYANEYFSEPELDGWQTARGKAYTLYGSPDDQFNREWNGNIYEIWSYEDRGLDFVFLSREGHWAQIYPITNN